MNPDEQFLLEKAKENVVAAHLLSERGFPEIAASRAYYAMFYLAEALLKRRSLAFSSHGAVIAAFGKEYSKTNDLDPKFHQYLIKSQQLRQTGDYGYNENISAESVSQVIAWAEEFLASAEEYLLQGNT